MPAEVGDTSVACRQRRRGLTGGHWRWRVQWRLRGRLSCRHRSRTRVSCSRTRRRLSSCQLRLAGWQGPDDGAGRWHPNFEGGVVERQAVYRDAGGGAVDVFVAVYGLGATHGAEMISYSNVVSSEREGRVLPETSDASSRCRRANVLEVRELVVHEGEGPRLVWQWYVVGERPAVSPYATKALEALAFVTRSADSERVVTVSTPFGRRCGADDWRSSSHRHGRCVAHGFPVEACGG